MLEEDIPYRTVTLSYGEDVDKAHGVVWSTVLKTFVYIT
jgi:hypothetical protein